MFTKTGYFAVNRIVQLLNRNFSQQKCDQFKQRYTFCEASRQHFNYYRHLSHINPDNLIYNTSDFINWKR